jgi:hypothetical protein
MQQLASGERRLEARWAFDLGSPHPPAHLPAQWGRRAEDRQFVIMEQAFNRTGGLTTSDEIARLTRRRCEQPISELARWIVSREVVSFTWQSVTLLPTFQFELADMTLHDGTRRVIRELVDVYDNWGLAWWFACPNHWLDGRAPADAIAQESKDVLNAARADRFVALG